MLAKRNRTVSEKERIALLPGVRKAGKHLAESFFFTEPTFEEKYLRQWEKWLRQHRDSTDHNQTTS